MTLFLKLLLAHIIGDFCLQPDRWVASKHKFRFKSKNLYTHVAVHAGALVLILGFDFRYWLGFTIIIVSHYLIDLAKLYVQNNKNALLYFTADQALHLLVLAFVAHYYEPLEITLPELLTAQHLLLAIALLLAVFVPAVLIRMMIDQWRPATNDNEDHSLIRAGKVIGILERLLVFTFIITHHWEAVGFLLAAKSIFRFGDLRKGKDRKLTEYVLIGTLLSFGSAILIGMGYLYLGGKL